MMRFDPFREIEELTQRMDRAFGSSGGTQGARLAPPVDVHEDGQGLELTLDLPGVSPDSIQIEAENQTLSVQAERRYERTDGRTAHRVERAYGTLSRTFSVPAKYDLTKVEADFDHGTLTIRVPRSEAAQKRSINVRTAGQLTSSRTVDSDNADNVSNKEVAHAG
ncbi:Hsp20/alpha crystallin family protein [Deinococcus deserti]|uniref:Putative heat shock protein n=1 Tax=Deinococcus deserti (strain DSM 17065 / CIP 109153 / LMG 22923 / VCD115) TaxID=546414 RepID=C1CX79_DEIDV|nr:Hsp20/alpha crystallin family protein [Deinococcus deserti]ACO46796.1 putative heat shock protein [Deinococcus deserti VCD115]